VWIDKLFFFSKTYRPVGDHKPKFENFFHGISLYFILGCSVVCSPLPRTKLNLLPQARSNLIRSS
jgi:hypothetical protein